MGPQVSQGVIKTAKGSQGLRQNQGGGLKSLDMHQNHVLSASRIGKVSQDPTCHSLTHLSGCMST